MSLHRVIPHVSSPSNAFCRAYFYHSHPALSIMRRSTMRQIAHWLRQPLKRYSSIPTQSTPNAHEASEEPLHVGETVTSDSGQTYRIEEILKEYRRPLMCVYRASSQGKPYLLKNPVPRAFERYKELIESLASAPHIRPLVDSITPLKIFVYPFLDGHLLDFAKKNLSPNTRRNIVRDALRGLAEMHDRGAFHNDIKPDNVCINYRENGEEEPTITDVQIGDLEDAAHFTERGGIKGCVCGNHLWRSPESWAAAHQSTPSDIFSFGLFALYVVLQEMVMAAAGTPEQLESPDSWKYILRSQISFFGDP